MNKQEFSKKLWKIFNDHQFISSTDSITDEVENFPDAITDMEATIRINGEFDKDDLEEAIMNLLNKDKVIHK